MGRVAAIAIALLALPVGAVELVPGAVILTEEDVPRLLQFDPASGQLSLVSGPGAGTGPAFLVPWDVARGPDGLLYVADAEAGVFRVDPASGDRELLLPAPFVDFARSAAFDSQGFLYVLDSDNSLSSGTRTSGRVYRIDLVDDGFEVFLRTSSSATTAFAPRDLAIAALDRLLIGDRPGQVKRLEPDGSLTTIYSRNLILEGLAMDPVTNLPYVMAVDPANVGLYQGRLAGGMAVVSRNGLAGGVTFVVPSRAAVAPDGSVYVTDRARGLFRVDPATGQRTLLLQANGIRVRGIALLPEDLAIVDADDDGVTDVLDLCPDAFDPGQEDTDGNRVGDACNDFEDPDGDEFADALDNCPAIANASQSDRDGDGLGDACNDAVDLDGDDFRDDLDNCPATANDQIDFDGDGLGDACDPFPFAFDNEKEQLRVDLAMCLEREVFADADGDGEADATDACAQTPSGSAVDAAGCSQEQFCALRSGGGGLFAVIFACLSGDWRNDESTAFFPGDCQPSFGSGVHCVAALP